MAEPHNSMTTENGHVSPWAPLREPLFRSLWIAAVISYTGTWMQNMGAGWLMTQLTMSPLMIGLVQAATTLPVFLVILPAGALADMVDRRRFLLVTQGWMVVAASALGILSITHHVTPWLLLLFTFVLGLGAVMNDPAWQAITPEIVPARCHAPAVALGSVGFNLARSIGPALGGLVIAMVGSGVAFLLNALSFFGVIFFLYRWQRTPSGEIKEGRVSDAVRKGLQYVRNDPMARCVLIRTGAFSLGASSLLAFLPILARPHGPTGYGLSLGSFGLGALAGAVALPGLRRRLSVDRVVVPATLVFALMTFLAGRVHAFAVFGLILFFSGMAWISIVACLNIAAQTMSPHWLRARALSMYILVLQGGMAIGSALWGALATRLGVPDTLLCSAAALMAGLLTVRRYQLKSREIGFGASAMRDRGPMVQSEL